MSNEDKRVDNPFGSLAERSDHSMQQVESDRAMQEVQAGMVIAKRFPRDRIRAMDQILQACTQPALAEQAQYAYPKGDQLVSGPSIRLAEVIAQTWGNLWCGVVELARHPDESVAEAYAWDLETNTRDARIFTVPHLRHTKKGSYKIEDPREIYELLANQGARRKRAAIQTVIPREVFDAACRQCDVTLAENVEVNEEAIEKMAKAFQDEFGVGRDQLVKYLGHRLDSMINAEMLRLRKVFTALRDGFATPRDYFDMPSGEAGDSGEAAQASGADRFRSKVAAARGERSADPAGTAQQRTAAPQQSDEPKRDRFGVRWDERIHASSQSQTKEGRWTRRRGISDGYYQEVLAELTASDRRGTAEGESPQEPTGAHESGDPAGAGEGSAPDPAAGAGEPAGGAGEDSGPPAGMDPETGELGGEAGGRGPEDSEIVNRILRALPDARENGDLDTLTDLEDEAREIVDSNWRAQMREQIGEARRAIEAGAA